MARWPKVFAISISMQAGDGVALPVAVMAAVATVVPVVVAMTNQTVNVAAAMVTMTLYGGVSMATRMPAQSGVQPWGVPLAQEACIGHQMSGHNQAPAM